MGRNTRRVAKALDGIINRAGDLAARYGGEEFGVILQSNTAQGAIKVAEILRGRVEALKIPHENSGASNFVTVSLGVATTVPEYNISSAALIEEADKALYRAKEKGRNRVEVLRDGIEKNSESGIQEFRTIS